MDWKKYNTKKAETAAYFKNYGKKKCPKCGLYGCICQTQLREFGI